MIPASATNPKDTSFVRMQGVFFLKKVKQKRKWGQ